MSRPTHRPRRLRVCQNGSAAQRMRALLATTLLAITAASTAAGGRPSSPTAADALVLGPDATVAGESFGALTARWWQWAERMPIAPYLDPDGRLCDLDQSGEVWFLAGTDGSSAVERSCVIPAGRHILVPVINMRHSNPASGHGRALPLPCKVLQEAAAVNNDRLGSAVVLLDGVPVTDVARYRVRSAGCFRLYEGDDTAPLTASDGYWLLIKPLPPGRHVLSIGANYAAGEAGYGEMVQNFEYDLHVGGWTNLL
ncbi:hypothetical protein [Cognatilysobacter bugurensis]|uniref:Uncharacterized protein n=1 Tax=Cognatilysobacter bugurensis TaxID=543356 RepID=A0A918T243_9GAMM|nr:hypothetical protein [Lysobacter bugurensis]GHA83815.1 hypothetical protein GCM10007067_22430 [Lysobacter bugurensis]